MNAPYDGDRGDAAANSGHPESDPAGGPPPGHDQASQPPADPYVQDAYAQDPYRAQDIDVQDPVAEALYDRSAHPPPPPGAQQPQQPLYGQPPQSPYAPDPRVWARTPAPEPDGPTQHLPYGDDPRTTQYVGVDDLVGEAGEPRHEPDAFAHLFRDQQQSGAFPDRNGGQVHPQGAHTPDSRRVARPSTPPPRCPDPRPRRPATTRAPLRPPRRSPRPRNPLPHPRRRRAAAPAAC